MVRIRGPTGWTPLDIVEEIELGELERQRLISYSGDKTRRGPAARLPNLKTQVTGVTSGLTALGALQAHINSKSDESKSLSELHGLVPPPFKYLGPGNSLNRGQPYNQIDADAQQHDFEYSVAQTPEDIYKSDIQFIAKSGDHIAEGLSSKGSIGDTIGAIAGGIGIGAKHLLEKSTGSIQYPKLSGKYASY